MGITNYSGSRGNHVDRDPGTGCGCRGPVPNPPQDRRRVTIAGRRLEDVFYGEPHKKIHDTERKWGELVDKVSVGGVVL